MIMRVLLIFLTVLSSMLLAAREKSDVLIMKNGDRLTCEIKSLSSGVLYVSLDYILGTSSLEWSKVAHVESKQLFIVKTEDGSVYTGTLGTAETGAGRPVEIQVHESLEEVKNLRLPQVVSVGQTSERFWQRFNGSINSGIIFSKANLNTQYSLGADTEYVRERWSAGAAVNSTLSDSTGTTTATRNDLTFNAQRLLSWNNYFCEGLANFLQSSEQGIELQSSLGGGIGRYLKNSNTARIQVLGGLAWQRTKYEQHAQPQATQNVAAALVAVKAELFRFNKTNLSLAGIAFPALNDPGRVFLKANATYYVKVFGDLSWNFSFYGNWDNQPPPSFSGSDYGTSSGLSWTFGSR